MFGLPSASMAEQVMRARLAPLDTSRVIVPGVQAAEGLSYAEICACEQAAKDVILARSTRPTRTRWCRAERTARRTLVAVGRPLNVREPPRHSTSASARRQSGNVTAHILLRSAVASSASPESKSACGEIRRGLRTLSPTRADVAKSFRALRTAQPGIQIVFESA